MPVLPSVARRLGPVYAFARLGRPLFLVGGLLFYNLGVMIALVQGAGLRWPAWLLGQVAVSSGQWMTHYANDYFDLPADRLNSSRTRWAGGSGVLPEGKLPPWLALGAALFLGGISLLASLAAALWTETGAAALPLLLLALLLAWGYSGPPLRLHWHGWGEGAAALLVPALVPAIAYVLQAGRLAPLPLLATLPLACFQFALILVLNYPDAAGDARAGKRTLLLRLGPARAARWVSAAWLLPYALLPGLLLAGLPGRVALALGLTLPLALAQVWRLRRQLRQPPGPMPAAWDSLNFWALALLVLGALFELLGFLSLF